MPVVPVETNKVGLASVTDQKLQSPNMDGVGEGLANAMGSVARAGLGFVEHQRMLGQADAAEAARREDEARRTADFARQTDIITFGAQQSQALLEQSRALDGPGVGFRDKFIASFDDHARQWLSTVPEDERAQWNARMSALRAETGLRAQQAELGANDAFYRTGLDPALDKLGNAAMSAPSHVEQVRQQGHDVITATGLSEAEKAERHAKWDQHVSVLAATGDIALDPQGAIARLGGVPTVERRAGETGAASPATPGTETRRVVSGKVRIDGHGTPVTDAASVLRATYPNAHMTDNVRPANSRLGRENPSSYHVQTRAAIDVLPIQGMTFDQYAQGYRDKGYTIIEAREETGAGRSQYATGDHWHIVLGQPGSAPASAAPARAHHPVDYGVTDAPGMVSAGNIDLANRQVVHNRDGSISTEYSFSIGTDKGEVLLPQVVGGKMLTQQQAIAHYRKTGENLGVFATPDAAEAYAQALHEKQGRRYGATNGDAPAAPPVDPRYASLPAEARAQLIGMAQRKIDGDAQAAARVQQQQHADWLNTFELKIHDGHAGQADIEAARKRGMLTDADEITHLENAVAARDAKSADINRYNALAGTRGFTWNPYDPDQRKAVEAAVDAQGGTPMAAFNVWQRTGVLAKSGAVALRGGLVSVDPTQVGAAANIAGNMIRRNPNAFAGVEGREDIEKAAVAFNHYVYDLGMAPQQAAARVAKENDPAFKAKVHLGQPERDQFMKGLRQQGLSAAQALGGQFYSTSQSQEADQNYAELTLQGMDRGLDVASAQAQAKAQMARVYGVTRDGHITKYAPERGYPVVDGSHDYVYEDAIATVRHEVPRAKVSDVHIVPIPGVTDQDFRAGVLPHYQLLYGHMVDGQRVYDIVRGRWQADVAAATAAATAKHHTAFAQAQAYADDRVAHTTPLNSGVRRPETGPGSNPLEDK